MGEESVRRVVPCDHFNAEWGEPCGLPVGHGDGHAFELDDGTMVVWDNNRMRSRKHPE